MGESLINWLETEIENATDRTWTGKPVIGFCKGAKLFLESLWRKEVEARGKENVEGWKTDFQKGARRLLLEIVTHQPVNKTDEAPGWQLRMVGRWLDGQLPTGYSDDFDIFDAALNAVKRKDQLINLFYQGEPTMTEIAWYRADIIFSERETEKPRRAPFPLKEVA